MCFNVFKLINICYKILHFCFENKLLDPRMFKNKLRDPKKIFKVGMRVRCVKACDEIRKEKGGGGM